MHVLIISGGYGVLPLGEPIGKYDIQFSLSQWPAGLLGSIVTGYAQRHGLLHVRAFFAATTSYQKAVTGLPWAKAGIRDALLITPVIKGGGASGKSPRTQGEAFCAALNGELTPDWCSRSGIPISVSPVRV